MNNLWTDKYKPTSFNQIIGNTTKVKQINEFFENFKNPKSKKILLLSGPPGIGKTTIANLALKKYGYLTIEFNSSTIRGPKQIRNVFQKVFEFRSVIDIFTKGQSPTGIIMDEIDTLCFGGDKGGMAEFLSIIKSRKKKDEYDINNPIICTYNHFSDKKLTELKGMAVEVKMTKPTNYELSKFANKIIKEEGLKVSEDILPVVINHSMGDIRRLLNILYTIKIKDVEITEEDIEDILDSFDKKNIDPEIFNITHNIFSNKLTDEQLLAYYDSDRLLYPMMLHQNYVNNIYNRDVEYGEKVELIKECAEAFVENDIYQTRIYENQLWEIADNTSLILCKVINKLSEIKRPITKKDKSEYTVLLNRISFFYTNKKFINGLDAELGLNMDFYDMYYLSELLAHYTFNKTIDKDKINDILGKYNISKDKLDMLFRVNRFYNDKRKFTAKMKKTI